MHVFWSMFNIDEMIRDDSPGLPSWLAGFFVHRYYGFIVIMLCGWWGFAEIIYSFVEE